MAAPENNQNASKPEGEAATKVLHAAITPTDKGLFKLAAEEWARENGVNDGRGVLTLWVLTVLRAHVPQHIRDRVAAQKQIRDMISKQKQ